MRTTKRRVVLMAAGLMMLWGFSAVAPATDYNVVDTNQKRCFNTSSEIIFPATSSPLAQAQYDG